MSDSGFHDVSFPMPLALNASGGPEWRVDVVALASGEEIRNAPWRASRRRWDVGSAVMRLDALATVLGFFEARGGRRYGFRFRDPFDHTSASLGNSVSPTDQLIGQGDGTTQTFQLVKAYGVHRRVITKPVHDSVRAGVDGVEQSVTVDPVTGRISFANPPPPGAAIMAGFLFDCAVRFDTDRLELSRETFGAGRVLNLALIELTGDTDAPD